MTKGTSRGVLVWLAFTVGCGAGDNTVDPADLGLRDLLGVSPDVAMGWSAAQRAAARRVLGEALRAPPDALRTLGPGATGSRGDTDTAAIVALVTLDAERARDERDPLAVVRVHVASDTAVEIAPRAGGATGVALLSLPHSAPRTATSTALWLGDGWSISAPWAQLPGRGLAVLDALARDAGLDDPAGSASSIVVVPAPQLSVIAAYIAHDGAPAHLAVNPVVLAAIEPATDDEPISPARVQRPTSRARRLCHGGRRRAIRGHLRYPVRSRRCRTATRTASMDRSMSARPRSAPGARPASRAAVIVRRSPMPPAGATNAPRSRTTPERLQRLLRKLEQLGLQQRQVQRRPGHPRPRRRARVLALGLTTEAPHRAMPRKRGGGADADELPPGWAAWPHVVAWLAGWMPDGLAPTWFTCVGVAGLVGLLVMRGVARRHRLDDGVVATAVLWCYVAAVGAGIALPMVIDAAEQVVAHGHARWRWAGMTSFWGYLGGLAAVAVVCRRHAMSLARFGTTRCHRAGRCGCGRCRSTR